MDIRIACKWSSLFYRTYLLNNLITLIDEFYYRVMVRLELSLAWCEHYLCFQVQKKFQINQTTWDSNKKYMLLCPKQRSSEKAKNDHFGQKVNDDPISLSRPRLQTKTVKMNSCLTLYFKIFHFFENCF